MKVASAARALPILLALVVAARTAGAAPSFPQGQICTGDEGDRTVDPIRLVQWLIASGPVSDAALDTNGDGNTLLAEKQLALTAPRYCSEIAKSCTSADDTALRRLHADLVRFVQSEGGEGYRFERRRRPTVEERRAEPSLARALETPDQRYQIGEVLDAKRRFVRIACVPQKPVAGPAEGGFLGWRLNPERRGGFRLTGDIDDLSREGRQLANVQPAQFSVNANLREDTNSYQIATVAGYDFELERSETLRSSLIPFVQFERFFDGTEDELDKLGAGVQAVTVSGAAATGTDQIAITPMYVTDTNFETRIGTLKLRWTPTLSSAAPLPLGFDRTYGPAVLSLSFDGLSEAGRVFNRGESSPLENESNFIRFGGRLGFRIRGAPDTALSQVEFQVADKYLINFGSGPTQINRLDVTLSYLFHNSENYRIGFSYSLGRDDDTLQKIASWSTQLGIRF